MENYCPIRIPVPKLLSCDNILQVTRLQASQFLTTGIDDGRP